MVILLNFTYRGKYCGYLGVTEFPSNVLFFNSDPEISQTSQTLRQVVYLQGNTTTPYLFSQ